MNFQGLQKVDYQPKSLLEYTKLMPEVVKEIQSVAKDLKGLRVVHLNATAVGGGVAEILRSEVPLQTDTGLDESWYVIPPNMEFFEVTKKIHNLMQGKPGRLKTQEKKVYIQYNKFIAQALSELQPQPQILIIHDPQPAALISFLSEERPDFVIWRCHIDTSSPNPAMWQFLLPYLKCFDHFIFTLPEYTHKDFPPPNQSSFFTPVIDPFSAKNILMDKGQAKEYTKKFGIDIVKPLVTQVSRLDPWKDPLGVIDAYRLAKKEIPTLQLALVAQSATDDPEGEVLYTKVRDYIGGEKGIFLLVNLRNNDKAVNAFQTASSIILQKSIREGFGLTVTEAMWKGAVVIGGNVGGIKLQIKDGVNGFVVNSPIEAARKIIYVLNNPQIQEKISQNAHESVKNKFLMPHAIINYLNLFKTLLNR